MTGTVSGGKRSAVILRSLYGPDFYKRIGKKGGSVKNPNKGFASFDPEKRSEAGKKGGANGRRTDLNIPIFIKIWNESATNDEVALRLNKSIHYINCTASRLRKLGYDVSYRKWKR